MQAECFFAALLENCRSLRFLQVGRNYAGCMAERCWRRLRLAPSDQAWMQWKRALPGNQTKKKPREGLMAMGSLRELTYQNGRPGNRSFNCRIKFLRVVTKREAKA